MRLKTLCAALMLLWTLPSLLQESAAQTIPTPRTAVINGTRYRVFYHWTNEEWGNKLIQHGSYDARLNTSYLDYAADLERSGKSTGNFADPGLNISANTHDSAWFAGRSGADAPDGKVQVRGKLLEVLVPEAQLQKAKFNDYAGQYMGASWYHVDQGVEGSIIQEYKGTGMTEAEMIAAYEKVVSDPDVKRRLEKENAQRAKAGLKPLKAHPAVEYLQSRIPSLVDQKNVPEGHALRKAYSKSPAEVKNAARSAGSTRSLRGALPAGETTRSILGEAGCSSGRTAMGSAVDATLGKAGGAFGVVDAIVPLLVPESNPFAGSPVGYPCEDAHARKGKVRCEWDSPLNPLNNIVYCSRITSVHPTGEKTFSLKKFQDVSVCSVTYDYSGFRADDPKAKDYLEKGGYLDNGGSVESMDHFIKSIRSRTKITDVDVQNGLRIPATTGKNGANPEYS